MLKYMCGAISGISHAYFTILVNTMIKWAYYSKLSVCIYSTVI